uniref:Uncharacterized protein n=1 Tax=Romanomermis culicivorax TaxID=13658 RepID=A0A915JLE6_ROMCU
MLDMRCLNIDDRRSRLIKNVHQHHEISSAESILTLHDCDTLEQMRQAWHRLCDAGTADDDSIASLHQAYCRKYFVVRMSVIQISYQYSE